MSKFWFRTTSTKPRLRDPSRVQTVIDKYCFDFDLVVSVNHGDCRLIIDGCGWPSAWRLPPNTSAEAYDPDYGTDGRKEFEAFLAEIAPFLDETLIIQSIGSASGRFSLSACEWRVAPGASNVEKTEISSAEALPPLARASAC